MPTVYDFHMDFQFWVHLTTLRGLQMVWYPRNTRSGPGQIWMEEIEIFFFQGQDFVYTHPKKYVEIDILKKCTKKNTTLIDMT